ncbi:hypothetical protein J5N97_000884 [Dioscorea zingiberensis]|uniref:Uncharacterized protein n=1 Tax=Dioscorea zingiberensis TaxID=325984 RepID=A0A9D5BUN4_9LILI|nr:hypothetical protein J5N97_000884 [Dioscorea zingiberensis]
MLSNSLFDSLLISSIPAVGSRFNGYPFGPNLTSLHRSFAGPSSAHRREVSSLSVEPCEGEWLVVTVFEIKKEEVSAFMEREHEFRFLAAFPEDLEGKPFTRPAVICARYSDDEYFCIRCKGTLFSAFKRFVLSHSIV